MEVNSAIKTIEKIAPDVQTIFSDEEATEHLAAWMNGYVTRARLEERKEADKCRKKGDIT